MALFALVTAASPLLAQGRVTSEPLDAPPGTENPPAASQPARKSGKSGADGPAAAPSSDAALRQRVEQLEEQLVDMQVVIGTLESLARSGGGAASGRAAPAGGSAPSDNARLDGIETQIRALTSQLDQLSLDVRASTGQPRRAGAEPAGGGSASTSVPSSFGSTTVTSGDADPINGLLDEAPEAPAPPRAEKSEAAPGPLAAADPAPAEGEGGNPKELYERAYGFLLQQNYTAAETAFDSFLKRFPNDSLSGNAQYWLGESYFVRGQYKPAASAFLKGYETYSKSAKAPDSLLKLAMSLDRLGQKDAACSSYSELETRFPNAAPHVKTRAQTERQRVGCP